MSEDTVIRRAEFDPAVKTYWLLSGIIILVVTIVGIPLLLLWVPIGLILTKRYLDRMSCELSEKDLRVSKGIMVRVEKTIPLEKITDMAVVQGPIMRALGIHRLNVETAGQSGPGSLVSLTGIVEAKAFREAVLKQRDALSQQASAPAPDTGTQATDLALLTDIRDSLVRIEKALQAQRN